LLASEIPAVIDIMVHSKPIESQRISELDIPTDSSYTKEVMSTASVIKYRMEELLLK
jgi:hypothetical protein